MNSANSFNFDHTVEFCIHKPEWFQEIEKQKENPDEKTQPDCNKQEHVWLGISGSNSFTQCHNFLYKFITVILKAKSIRLN